MLGQTASATAAASDNSQFQTNLQTSFAARASAVSGVNIDQELADLATFQNMYAASAHVLSAVNNMLNTLMQI
jgi:flagellar hook-associated protein 1